MTDHSAKQYGIMASVYDRWMERDQPPYDAWAAFIDHLFRERNVPSARVLDIGCGTGAMSLRLDSLGWEVTGIDASPDMIALAKEKSGSVRFIRGVLPEVDLSNLGTFGAMTATFDILNYFSDKGELDSLFANVFAALEPGGVAIFDANTRYKLSKLYGFYHSGDDFGDFAYVWRNRYDADKQWCKFELSFFVRQEDGLYERFLESHTQRWFSEDELKIAVVGAGLSFDAYSVAYTNDKPDDETPRITITVSKAVIDGSA